MAGWISASQFDRDHRGLRNACCACGHDGTPTDPLVLDDEGFRVHQQHTEDPNSGLYGHRQR